MRVELTDEPTAFVARDWTPLVEIDPHGAFFHTPAYLKLWWEEFGSGNLLLAFVEDGGRTVAASAFEVVQGELRFLGGFDVTDYMGPVGLAGSEEPACKELMAALTAAGGWERADLRSLPVDSAWYGALAEGAASAGWRVERGEDGITPLIDLPAAFEDYLSGLPAKLRHEIRRKRRRLLQEGPVVVRFSTPEALAEDLDRFFDLHRQSPGPKGKFMHAGMEIFFRRLAEAFLSRHVFHLAFLEVDGVRAAGAVGFGYGDTFSLYNSAFDRSFAQLSPGMVLVSDLIAEAIGERRATFDLLKGDLEYKYRFGARPRPLGRLVLER